MSQRALEQLVEHMSDGVLSTHAHRGDETAVVRADRLRDACLWLRDTPGLSFDMLTDLTAVDYIGEEPRFEVVYHLYSIENRHRLRLKVGVAESDLEIASIHDIWSNANWCEREVWDMYGIRFTRHPDMRRILLYEEFEGHPLRKDYPKEKRQPLVRRPADEIAAVLEKRSEQKRDLL